MTSRLVVLLAVVPWATALNLLRNNVLRKSPSLLPPEAVRSLEGFRFVPLENSPSIPALVEFEALARTIPTYYAGARPVRRYKEELLAAGVAVAARCGGVGRVGEGLGEAERRRAFVFLSFLAHFYVWCEDGKAEAALPETLAAPYLRVARELGCVPVYTDACIMWNMVGPAGSWDPDDCFLDFCWTSTTSERWFAVIQGAILRRLDPLMGRAAYLKDAVLPLAAAGNLSAQDAARAAAIVDDFLDDLDAALVDARAIMGRMFEKLDPNDFLVFRRYFEGWRSASEYSRLHLPDGLAFPTGDGAEATVFAGVPGANAGQQGSWHCVDALLGVDHDEAFLRDQRTFMPAQHRAFVDRFVADPETNLRTYFDARPDRDRERYSRCVRSLRAWRRDHISLASAYLITFAEEIQADPTRPKTDRLHVKGTGGSETKGSAKSTGFVSLLQSHIRETRDPGAAACPFASARGVLHGSKFTKAAYADAADAPSPAAKS